MVFITIGAGGGTGSGAGHIVALKLLVKQAPLVVGFATRPFAFEGEKRRKNAEYAIDKLRGNVGHAYYDSKRPSAQTIDRRTTTFRAFKVAR